MPPAQSSQSEATQLNVTRPKEVTRPKAAKPKHRYAGLFAAPLLVSGLYSITHPIAASAQSIQVAPDGTGTLVTPNGNTFTINGGSLSRDGANLFHSFQRFGLTQGQIANFLANPAIRNILGRIVGGDPSVIDGLVRVTGSNANLFLINPAGVIFGPNARLDVAGDFTATTATRLRFESDRWFNAFGSNDYASLVGTPSFFMFDAAQAGSIINAGQLSLQPGKTLLLLGGNVINVGQLSAPNGNILVAAVPGTGRVRISRPGGLLSLEVETTNTSGQMIPITPLDLPKLLTVGAAGLETGVTATSDNTVQLANSSVQIPTAPGTTVISGQVSVAGQQLGILAGQLPQIGVLGDRVALLNANLDASGVNGGGTIRIGGDYRGKGTVPNAKQTFVSQDSVINTSAQQNGHGGNVFIWADETTRFNGQIKATGGAQSGNGGFVEVSGKQQLAVGGKVDISAPAGTSGTALFDPRDIIIVPGTGANDGEIADGSIFANDGGTGDFVIGTTTLASITGNIQLQATRNITFNTSLTLTETPNALFSLTADGSIIGNGQNIVAPARNLTITAGTIENLGEVRTNTATPGVSGGNITLTATNGGIQTRLLQSSSDDLGAIGTRRGGDITLNATGDIVVDGDNFSGAIKTGENAPSGNMTLISGGNIRIDGFVSASNNVQPGNIRIQTPGLFQMADGPLSIENRGTPRNFNAQPRTINVTAGSIDLQQVKGNNSTLQGITPATNGLVSLTATTGDVRISGSLLNEGYPVQITSANGQANLGDLTTSGANGGNLSINAPSGITTGTINTSGDPGNGGNVSLETRGSVQLGSINTQSNQGRGGDIEVNIINAQGGNNGSGGNVNVGTDQFFRVLDTFVDRNGVTASISTAGGQGGGSIRIEQGNNDPFGVGDLSQRNGTAGAITTGEQTLSPVQVITVPYRNGKIAIQKPNRPIFPTPRRDNPPKADPPPSCFPACGLATDLTPPNTELPKLLYEDVETQFTGEFEKYLGRESGSTRIKTLEETQRELKHAEDATGIKTVLVYVFFRRKEFIKEILDQRMVQEKLQGYLAQNGEFDDDELHLVMVTSDGRPIWQVARDDQGDIVTRKKILGFGSRQGPGKLLASNIRKHSNTNEDYKEAAKELYKFFVTPFEEDLQKIKSDFKQDRVNKSINLSFLLDGQLRSIPLATLHNGKDFIIEHYSVGLMPSFSLIQAEYKNIANLRLLVMGASDFPNLPMPLEEGLKGLPATKSELTILLNQVWKQSDPLPRLPNNQRGSSLDENLNEILKPQPLHNENFVKKELEPELRERRNVGIVHLATHARFAEQEKSYIYFWNKPLTVDEVSSLRLNSPPPPPIELLTLSACETGINDAKTEIGFATAAAKARVKSVLATLWLADSFGLFMLMTEFYRNLKQGIPKSEALRQAQLAMLKHQIRCDHCKGNGTGEIVSTKHKEKIQLKVEVGNEEDEQEQFPQPITDSFEHPYYWAAFTIIGNPW